MLPCPHDSGDNPEDITLHSLVQRLLPLEEFVTDNYGFHGWLAVDLVTLKD